MCVNHTNAYIDKYKRIWRKTRIALLRSKVPRGLQPYVLTWLEIPSSPQAKLISPNTMNVHQKTNNTSL